MRRLLSGLLVLGLAVDVAAAQDRAVTGTVVASGSRAPIAGAEVQVKGSDRPALTDLSGRFRLVLPGDSAVTIEIRRIGFRSAEHRLASRKQSIEILLEEAAVPLDAIVVTGTGGAVESRAVGNAIGTIAAPKLIEFAPIVEVQQLLSSRVPGLVTLPTQGNVGTGGLTQIRGVSSLTLSNEPLVFVDGIRTDNNTRAGPNLRDGRQVARINDIPTEDIENVEVLKGPAAGTIYGTEASRGVIQILTKQGAAGPPRVGVVMKQGANWFMNPEGRLPWVYGLDSAGQLDSMHLYREEAAAGRPIFQTGHVQSYGVSLGGGSPAVRYFLSTNLDREEGVLSYNWRRRLSTRANLGVLPSDRFEIRSSFGYITNTSRLGQSFDLYGVMDQIVWGSPTKRNSPLRGFFRATPEQVGTIDARSAIDRLIGTIQVRHQPMAWLSQRLGFGQDLGDESGTTLFPFNPDSAACQLAEHCQGEKSVDRRRVLLTTVDYTLSADAGLSRALRTTSTVGAQYYIRETSTSRIACERFADPEVDSCAGAAQTTGTDDLVENKSAGVYAQQQVAWKNRLFLTGAVRADDNSAFGEQFNIVVYPKVMGSWVLNEEPFWPFRWIGAFRVRAAWGAAGQQPDAFAAVRSYGPALGEGTLTPLNVGNPFLKPERASELEVGVDASAWNDRLSASFTWFDRRTKDAIVAQQVPPSEGFPGRRFINLGAVRTRGFELSLDGRPIDHSALSWDIGLALAHNDSRVESLGGLTSVLVTGAQEHRVGYPLAAYFQRELVSASLNAAGGVVNPMCATGMVDSVVPCNAAAPRVYQGQPTPRWQGNIRSTVTIGRRLRVYALVDIKADYTVGMGDIGASYSNPAINNSRAVHAKTDTLLMAWQVINAAGTVPQLKGLGIIDAGFAKLREVSLAYTLPRSWARLVGASNASVTVAGRNLAFLWRAQKESNHIRVSDPEVHRGDIDVALSGTVQVPFPQFAQLITTVRLGF